MPQKTKAQPIQPAAKPAANIDGLAPIQQLIADEIGDLIMRGGSPRDVDCVLWTALASVQRRFFVRLIDDEEEREARVTEMTRRDFDQFKAELVMSWKRRDQASDDPQAESKPTTERIRAMVIENLRARFVRFVSGGTPEEHRLMSEVLMDHECSSRGRDEFNELPLGKAFEYQLSGGIVHEYVRVPAHMQEQVQRYIECLKAADAKERAA